MPTVDMTPDWDELFRDVADTSVYEWARQAGIGSPDRRDSPGGLVIAEIRDTLIEWWREGRFDWHRDAYDNDRAHEVADSAHPDETHRKWEVFVDLSLYETENECTLDGTWSGTWDDMANQAIGQALSTIACQVAQELRKAQGDWVCPGCGDSGHPLACEPGECSGSDEEREAWQAELSEERVRDPLLDLINEAEAVRADTAVRTVKIPGDETARFMARMDAINEAEFARRTWGSPRVWIALLLAVPALAALVNWVIG